VYTDTKKHLKKNIKTHIIVKSIHSSFHSESKMYAMIKIVKYKWFLEKRK